MPSGWLVDLLSVGLTAACSLAAVPALVYALETLLASTKRDHGGPASRPEGLRVAILLPAHNEATGIAASIRSVREQMHATDQVLVVADNCTDDTAQVARAAGATVLERHNDTLRGKGYALDHGISHLKTSPPDMVIMLDADSVLHPGGLDELIAACQAHGAPIQSRYLMLAPQGASLKTRIAAFAWLVKNHVRPLGAQVMGWPCLLTGSGMAFPWPVIQNAPLASGHLVEDMQLGLDLAVAGHAPVFCERALVTSEFPSSDEGLSSQRTRWEHGHLGTIQSQLPRLLAQAVRQRRTGLLGLALDLSVPPLSSLILLTLALAAASLGFAALTGLWWATATPMMALLLLGAGTTSAWYRHGQGTLTPQEMLSIGSYVVHKLPVYLNFFTKRQVAWIRTRRDDGSK